MRLKNLKTQSASQRPLNIVLGPSVIRAVVIQDTPKLTSLARGTGVFSHEELVCLKEDLEAFHEGLYGEDEEADRIIALEQNGEVVGFAHYGRLVITDRTWMLHWIAVGQVHQSQGVGRLLMEAVESDVAAQNGRLILIETASNEAYMATRNFYVRRGYALAAVIEDYYCDGDHKCVYAKHLDRAKTY